MNEVSAYELRIGNGNDGEWFRARVRLSDDKAFSFMETVIANDFVVGSRHRRIAFRDVMVDGDGDYIHATVHEGPGGETHFGAAWRCATLRKLDDDVDGYDVKWPHEYLDFGCYRKFLAG